jgi:hypothetical protein
VQFFFLCEPSNELTFPNGIFLGKPQLKFDYSLLDYLKLAFIPKKVINLNLFISTKYGSGYFN